MIRTIRTTSSRNSSYAPTGLWLDDDDDKAKKGGGGKDDKSKAKKDDAEDDDDETDDKGDGKGKGDEGTRTLTQAELNRMMSREKEQGRNSATSALAKDLGVSIEEAKDIVAAHKKREEDEKSDAQKAKDAADKAKAEADVKVSDSDREKHELKVERALIRAGVPLDDDKAISRALKLVEVEVGDDDDAIKDAVKALKKDMPVLFESSEDDANGKKAPNSDPKGKAPHQKQNETAFSKGAERARARGNRGRGYPEPAKTGTTT